MKDLIEKWTVPGIIADADPYQYGKMVRWTNGPLRVYIGLRPSIEPGFDDVTAEHMRDLCETDGFGGFIQINCFNIRISDQPDGLDRMEPLFAAAQRGIDLIGPDGDELFQVMLRHPHVTEVVACWGRCPGLTSRLDAIAALIRNPECHLNPVKCYGVVDGQPKHIWRVDRGMPLVEFRP